VVICLVRGADLHTALLMPVPLTVSCFSKIQIGFTFLVLARPGSPGQRAVKRVCVCVCACVRACARACMCVCLSVLLNLPRSSRSSQNIGRRDSSISDDHWQLSLLLSMSLPCIVDLGQMSYRCVTRNKHTHVHSRLTSLCPGLSWYQKKKKAGTRRNTHPLTPILIIGHPLSSSSIYCDPQHPPSVYMPDA